jgi:hypothetical protein
MLPALYFILGLTFVSASKPFVKRAPPSGKTRAAILENLEEVEHELRKFDENDDEGDDAQAVEYEMVLDQAANTYCGANPILFPSSSDCETQCLNNAECRFVSTYSTGAGWCIGCRSVPSVQVGAQYNVKVYAKRVKMGDVMARKSDLDSKYCGWNDPARVFKLDPATRPGLQGNDCNQECLNQDECKWLSTYWQPDGHVGWCVGCKSQPSAALDAQHRVEVSEKVPAGGLKCGDDGWRAVCDKRRAAGMFMSGGAYNCCVQCGAFGCAWL